MSESEEVCLVLQGELRAQEVVSGCSGAPSIQGAKHTPAWGLETNNTGS